MIQAARSVIFAALLVVASAADASAQAGGGSSGFGGGGGGGGGGGFSGGGGGSGSGSSGDPIVGILIAVGIGIVLLLVGIQTIRFRRKVRRRREHVRTASAEAAEDDAYFAASDLEGEARTLFVACQEAWDARDRERLASLVGDDLLVEWNRRLDDFESKGWHNRVEVLEPPAVEYVGLVNREDDAEDRAVVRLTARLSTYVVDRTGRKIMRKKSSNEEITLLEYWTLARRGEAWTVVSIEQPGEGDHHLDAPIVASPWSDTQRLRDESLTELAVADGLPPGFTTADLAEVDFDGDARARALDLSLADARFGPDVLEAAARRAVAAWAEAVDGEDAALSAVASPEAVRALLYGGDASRRTRLVVRGPRVKRIRIAAVDVEREPATMTIEVEVGGRRYVEDRDTAAVVSGSKERAVTFHERWRLALDGEPAAPWRVFAASAPSGR